MPYLGHGHVPPSTEEFYQHCPKCGGKIVLPTPEEVIYCPHCGAGVKLKHGIRGKVLGETTTIDQEEWNEPQIEPGEVDLSEDEARSRWMRDRQDQAETPQEEASQSVSPAENAESTTEVPYSKPLKVSWKMCNACGAINMHPNANFCTACGANLRRGSKGESLLDLDEQAEHCMVCDANFRDGDVAIRCPHCGRLAHRTHFLQWVRDKGYCPACKQKTTQQELQQ
ncbi:MAG: hypothetical protein WED04_10480 [Promethearchaeati archaeon SRVP18_Atabeyarchaeia-1]